MSWAEEIAATPNSPKVSRSHLEGRDVVEKPASLLAQARTWDGGTFSDLSQDEYTLARIVASEHSSGTPQELACIGDADLNRAARRKKSVTQYALGSAGSYGRQGGGKRSISTARDPSPRHVRVAMALTRGLFGAPARGISRGATRYFDPRAQFAGHARWKRGEALRHCPPLVILRRWTYDLPYVDKDCSLGSRRGGDQQQWVGAIDGVDAFRLMLFRRADSRQDEMHSQAERIIRSRGDWQPTAGPPDLGDLGGLALAVVGLGLLGGLA